MLDDLQFGLEFLLYFMNYAKFMQILFQTLMI